jgi:hypothetical protein
MTKYAASDQSRCDAGGLRFPTLLVGVSVRGRGVTGKADQYRRLAQECLAMANLMATQETRATLITMAQAWHRLADEQEQASQVQPKDDDDTG